MNKLTKKLGTLAFAAAIAGAGLTTSLVAEPANQVEAAYYAADYNGQKATAINGLPSHYYPQQAYGTFSIGSHIELDARIHSGDKVIDTRLYQKKSDGTLQRQQIFYSGVHSNYGSGVYLSQSISTSVPAGTYVAVLTLQSADGTKYQLKTPDLSLLK